MMVDLIFRHDRFGRGGDHTAFNEEGYPAVRLTTATENFANQHSATDTFTNASVRYTAKVIRVNAAAAAARAQTTGHESQRHATACRIEPRRWLRCRTAVGTSKSRAEPCRLHHRG